MQKAITDTHATASLLHENLSTNMSTVKSNIEQFNKYIKLNWECLNACGESCDDLMINLFKGYQSTSDREFICYIKQK
jgi:formiminotetrahydrofolate cyclodeaminase